MTLNRVLWLIAAGPVSAFAATPVELPIGQRAAHWEEPLRIAGLQLATVADRDTVQMADLGETWALMYGERTVRVPEPHSADERADVALLARSLTRSLTLRTPRHPASPTPVIARAVEPMAIPTQPEGAADRPFVERAPFALVAPVDSAPSVQAVAPDLGSQSLPWASIGPVQPVVAQPRKRRLSPWTSIGMTHRPRTVPSLQLAFGVDLLHRQRVGLAPVISVHTERALHLPGPSWYRRTLREADVGLSGFWDVHSQCRLDAAVVASFRGYTEQQTTIHREWMPRLAIGGEVQLPGVRTTGLRMGLSTDLTGTQLSGGPLTEQSWLVPIEVSAALVVRLGSSDDPNAIASTPVRAMTPLPANVLDVP